MKKRYLIPLCLLFLIGGYANDLAGVLALGLLAVSYGLLTVGGVSYVAWILLNRRGMLKRKPSRLLFFVPLWLAAFACSSMLGVVFSTGPALKSGDGVAVEEELRYMFETDQSDRYSGRFIFFPARDAARLARTRQIIRKGADSLNGEASYHAAMVLQHGESPSDYESAYHLATRAAQVGVRDADQLSKAAYDRWQLSIGKPQKYGTQIRIRMGASGK